jgi:8-oxo-dGTP pyrophosphatase MutT (NUDIX family)
MVNGESVVTPLPAATVTLVRDAPRGLEVLMLKRSLSLKFMPGAYVFPGGGLDPADSSPGMSALCTGVKDEEASRALGMATGGLAYWIAAIREAFEEAGILLAYDSTGKIVNTNGTSAARYREHRRTLDERRGGFGTIVRGEGLRLATDRLTYFGHWITPVTAPRRYDTRFFLAIAPEHQDAMHDNTETVEHAWVRPRDALDRCAQETFNMRFPTIRTLERFAPCATTAALMAELKSSPVVRPLLPRMTPDGRTLLPGDAGYDELGSRQ